jgi:hypothetical protein
MSALRLSELLPCERVFLEVVHSYAEQRLPGSISDPIVSDNFYGNATFYLPYSTSNSSNHSSPQISNPSDFPKQLCGPCHLGNSSQNCNASAHFPLSYLSPFNKLRLCSSSTHSILAHDIPVLSFFCISSLCSSGMQLRPSPKRPLQTPAGAWSNW